MPFIREISLGAINFYLGSGSVYTNLKDLTRFIQFHLNRGRVDQNPILDEKFIDVMYTPSRLLYPRKGSEGNELDQALGLLISTSQDGNHRIGHTGGAFGFTAYMYWYPEYGFGALIMVNSETKGGAGVWINNIMKRLISEKLVDRNGFFDAIPWKEVWNSTSAASSVGHDPSLFTPYQSAWRKYEGIYRILFNGYKPYAYVRILAALFPGISGLDVEVREKDGYLEIVYTEVQRRHERLDEYQPGLFFTKDGECLDFRGEIPTFQNGRLKKIK